MAEAILEVVFENLSSLIEKELGLFFGVNKEIRRLESTLSTIRAVLEDAEEKQLTNPAVKNWLQKLKDAAFVLDDILDECSTQALRFQQGRLNEVYMSCSSYMHPKYLAFRAKIAKQMKEISETLDEIAKEKSNFHLNEAGVGRKTDVVKWRHQTTSVIAEVEVYGREIDRNRIIETLIGRGSDSESVFVYPIVGIGGLGKTTLAQFVFNDGRITEHFDLKMWVCVSEDFDLKRILKDVIESAQGNSCGDVNLEALQKHLQKIIKRKRYLLVLDDVWNEDQEKWNRLKYFLTCKSKGASILVTTRIAKVAYVTGSVPPHELQLLSNDDCWLLFKQRAFGQEREEIDELFAIGREIVKKCVGVPLAAKTLGSLLRFKSAETEWLHVKESNLWDLPQDETSILPALRLSYLNLPLQLRQCFAFCAIFPKDFRIEKNLLIHLWMANGFISSSGTMTDEDIGNGICSELYLRSFFQDAEKDEYGNIFRFKMHDLIHDLAQSVMDDASCIIVDESMPDLPRRIHHVSFHGSRMAQYEDRVYQLVTNYIGSMHSGKLGSMRTYLGPYHCPCAPFPPSRILSKFSSLRALIMIGVRPKLPSSIGHLIHLRYLDISCGLFKTLPQSICSLLNLQVLKLDYCYSLQKQPNRLKCLKGLCHLSMFDCWSLSSVPPKLGQLTLLRRLSIYIVGEKRGRMLAELKCLKLKGELRVEHLERVRSAEDAKKANMTSKHLNTLLLSWDRNYNLESQENAEKILEALEPHRNLVDLGVGGYKGVHWPHWMGNPTFKALSEIELVDCKNCLQLPPLGKLPTLKSLAIHNVNHLRYIDDESYNGGVVTSFAALKYLTLTMLPNLERLSKEEGENMFPYLSELKVAECPKLALPSHTSITTIITAKRCNRLDWGRFFHGYGPKSESCNQDQAFLSSVYKLRALQFLWLYYDEESTSFPNGMLQGLAKELHICSCTKLEVLPTQLNTLHALQKLHIERCDSLESFTEQALQGLHCLQTLTLADCKKFKCLSEGVQHLTSLKDLAIISCPEVEGLPAALQQITSLHSLCLHNLPKLVLLPHWLGNLTLLQTLDISKCPLLTSLPTSTQHISNLKNLYIGGCPELQRRCEEEIGEDWHKIAHVPHIFRDPNFTYFLVCSYSTITINYRGI